MLVRHDFTGYGHAEIFLSHFEHRLGGIHIWHVYTPLPNTPQPNKGTRYLGKVDFHPRGLRTMTGHEGFLTYVGESFKRWRIDAKGLHSDGEVTPAQLLVPVRHSVQRCPEDGEPHWQGPDDNLLPRTVVDGKINNGANELAKAAERGDLNLMSTLLDDWVSMYAMENADGEALRAAATTGRADALRFLFARSDSHPPVVLRQTISSAAWHGHPAALEVILAQAMGEELK